MEQSGETDLRREERLALKHSSKKIEIISDISLPVSLQTLLLMDESHPACIGVREGMTAHVYQLSIGGQLYALKKERDESLVKNEDGETAFLNEILVRKALEGYYKEHGHVSGLPRTLYASKEHGVILSYWIQGSGPDMFNRKRIRSLFDALWNLEQVGYFEWDLCGGNLLFDEEDRVQLYDFGYTYPIDPLTQMNTDGFRNPIFHMVERFETRFLMQHLMDIEEVVSEEVALKLLKIEKEEAVRIYQKKLAYLMSHGGSDKMIEFLRKYIQLYELHNGGLEALKTLYHLELYRSCVLDTMDDLSAPYANGDTLIKIQRAIKLLGPYYTLLKQQNYLVVNQHEMVDVMKELMAYERQVKNILSERRGEEASYKDYKDKTAYRIIKAYAPGDNSIFS